jgi:tRNA (guanine-N7-)-methyltransferase
MSGTLHPDVPKEVAARIQARRAELAETLSSLLEGRCRLTLEIGCGHGHYLTAYAEANPDEFCLGIDLIADRIDRANRKATRAGLQNLSFIKAEARETLDALPKKPAPTRVFVLFPDPWPKKRHHKNRLMRDPFLAQLGAVCPPGAELFFRTDFEPYYLDACTHLQSHRQWNLLPEVEAMARWPLELPTVFQQKAPTHRSALAIRSTEA